MIRKISLSLLLIFFVILIFTPSAFCAVPQVGGSVIDADILTKGGTLAVASFKAGPGATADEMTDKISDMLVKGITKAMLNHPSSLDILEGEDQPKADFLLDGFIEEFTRSGKLARWTHFKNEAYLSVDGEIWFEESGAKVLVFSSSVVINLKKEKSLDVAYQMGKAIGKFISTHGAKE